MSDNRGQEARNIETNLESQTRKPKGYVWARITRVLSAFRADFIIIENGASVRNIKIKSSNLMDRGTLPTVGKLYVLNGYPTDSKGNLASDTHDGKPAFLERNKNGIFAEQIAEDKDAPTEVGSVVLKDIKQALKDIGNIFSNPSSIAPNLKEGCNAAPITLQAALKNAKKINDRSTRIFNTAAPVVDPSSQELIPSSGEEFERLSLGEKFVAKALAGSYVEFGENGSVGISANEKGLVVDADGTMNFKGKRSSDTQGEDRPSTAGFPSSPNPAGDIVGVNTVFAGTMGPLSLQRLPNFSILNWTLKVMQGFKAIKSIIDVVEDPKTGDKKLQFNNDYSKAVAETDIIDKNVGDKVK